MATILNLPQELFDSITTFLTRRDCKNLRVTCTQLSTSAIPDLAREVHLALQPQSLENLQKLAADGRFAQHVEKLVIFPNMLFRFRDYAAWMQCVNKNAIIKKFKGNGEPVSAMMYRVYKEYKAAVEVQQALLPQWPAELEALADRFPRLRSLRSTMWYEGWGRKPNIADFGGRICDMSVVLIISPMPYVVVSDSPSRAWESHVLTVPPPVTTATEVKHVLRADLFKNGFSHSDVFLLSEDRDA